MELAPKKDVPPFRVPYPGAWDFIINSLIMCGEEISGPVVDASTAARWSKQLKQCLPYIREVHWGEEATELPTFDFKHMPIELAVRLKLAGFETPEEIISNRGILPLPLANGSVLGITKYRRGISDHLKTKKMSPRHRNLLQKFIEFCERSGGFEVRPE